MGIAAVDCVRRRRRRTVGRKSVFIVKSLSACTLSARPPVRAPARQSVRPSVRRRSIADGPFAVGRFRYGSAGVAETVTATPRSAAGGYHGAQYGRDDERGRYVVTPAAQFPPVRQSRSVRRPARPPVPSGSSRPPFPLTDVAGISSLLQRPPTSCRPHACRVCVSACPPHKHP